MELFLSYIALGVIAGFIAGLLGVGGGLIIVPILIFIFQGDNFIIKYYRVKNADCSYWMLWS